MNDATKDPQPYTRKPLPVNAMQYIGGQDSGKTIISWLNSMYVVAHSSEPYVSVHIDRIGTIRPGDWIVSFGASETNKKGYIQIMNEENFARRFDKREN